MQATCLTSRPPPGPEVAPAIPRTAPLTIERLLAGAGNYVEDPQHAEREADTLRPPRS